MDMTRLEAFIRFNDIRPATLAREAAVSRQHLLMLRKGWQDPTRKMMVTIALAASAILRKRISAGELFDLDGR